MSKNCPKCGKELPDEAQFCMDCGYGFNEDKSSLFLSNGKIFLVIIAVVVIIGLAVIAMTGNQDTLKSVENVVDNADHVDLTISNVGGYNSSDAYTVYCEAIFNSHPSDISGYNIKTTYCDSNGNEIGHETEKLDQVYYDSDYALTFGFYTTYSLPDIDSVKIEIVKDSEVIDTFTEKVDRNKIEFLNG